MDGNGRWAGARHLPRLMGHRAGEANIRRVAISLTNYGVKYLTLYAFSTENWKRPKDEVDGLFEILLDTIDDEVDFAQKNNIRLCYLGHLDHVPAEVNRKTLEATEATKDNTKLTISFAFNYGGRADIITAIQQLITAGVPPQYVTESLLSEHLYTSMLPDPDLFIRTGGEMRLSNFLLWQTAYTELYFTSVLWPDFDETEVEKALLVYSHRQRRFGGLDAQG